MTLIDFVTRRAERLDAATAAEIEAELAQAFPAPSTILGRSQAALNKVLNRLRGHELQLEQEIADKTEKLRQTRIVIAAYGKAAEMLDAGQVEEPGE